MHLMEGLHGICRPQTVVFLQSFKFRTRRRGRIHGCTIRDVLIVSNKMM